MSFLNSIKIISTSKNIPFSSNTFTSNTYYFDNFESYTQQEVTSVKNTILQSLEVYPNPLKDELFINLTNNKEKSEIILSDINGKKVLEDSFIDKKVLSIKELPAGLYILTVKVSDQVINQKLIKTKK